MAEAIAVIGIVASIAQLVQLTVSIGTGLHKVHSTYEDGASLTLKSISRECKVLKTAFSQIQTWVEDVLQYQQGAAGRVKDLEEGFSGFREPLSMLDEEVRKVLKDSKDGNEVAFGAKVRFLWNEETVKEYRDEVRWMAQALHFLLSASQLPTKGGEQAKEISRITKSISLHNKARSIKENGSIWSDTEFTFDDELVTSVAYRRAYKSFLVTGPPRTPNVPRQRKWPWNALGLFKNEMRRMSATPFEEAERLRDSSEIQSQVEQEAEEPWRLRVSGSSPASRDSIRPTDSTEDRPSLEAIEPLEPEHRAPPTPPVPAQDIFAIRWLQVRQNPAERRKSESADRMGIKGLSQEKPQSVGNDKIDGDESSGEETIESRVARIKALVAELTVTENAYDFGALVQAIREYNASEVRRLLYHETGEPRSVQLDLRTRHTIETDLLHELSKRMHGHKLLQLLMDHPTLNLDVNMTDSGGNTPLAHAVFKELAEAVDVLLGSGANTSATYTCSPGGEEFVINLAIGQRNGILQQLLQSGADPNQTVAGYNLPLVCALIQQNCDAIAQLLSYGASPYKLVDDSNEQAAMYVRYSFEDTDEMPLSLCKCLRLHGVDLAALWDRNGYTLLHWAAIDNNDLVARFLIEEAKVPRLARTKSGMMAWECVSSIRTTDENTGKVTRSYQKVTDWWPYDLRPPFEP